MKNIRVLTLFGISSLVFFILYLKYDKMNYYLGNNCNLCNEKLPFNLAPKYNSDYPSRFYLLDADGFELVGIGFRYETIDYTVKDFLGYGYNDTAVIVKCIDSLKNIRYLISYKTGYKSNKGTPDISFKDMSKNNFELVRNNFNWVEIDFENRDRIKLFRTLFLIAIFLSLFLLVLYLYNVKNQLCYKVNKI